MTSSSDELTKSDATVPNFDKSRTKVINKLATDVNTESIHPVVNMPMGYDQLKRYLPHRYPFMLVDRVVDCSPSQWIRGYKNVSINEPYFSGHFPNEPIMPGVLIVEALAQISGILAFISQGLTAEDGFIFLFAGIDKVRFKSPVIPGDCLMLHSELVMNKSDVYKFASEAYVDDKLVTSAQITIIRQQREP